MADPYDPPAGNAVGLTFSSDDYTPPAGNAVPLEFNRGGFVPGDTQYLFPAAVDDGATGQAAIWNYRTIASPSGIPAGGAGAPSVWLRTQWARPAGLVSAAYGHPAIANWNKNLYPAGLLADRFGTPAVENLDRYLHASGFAAGGFGVPTTYNLRRHVAPTGITAALFGTPTLAGGVRTLDQAGRGIAGLAAGHPVVTFRERLVIPVGTDMRAFGTPTMGRHVTLAPEGYEATRFGTAEVRDNSQRLYPAGVDSQQHGAPFIAPRVRTLAQQPLVSPGGIGHLEVRNSRRYLAPFSEVGDWGPFFGNFAPFVANRNRTITTFGHASAKISVTHTIELGGRALRVVGADAAQFGTGMVADAIRSVATLGADTAIFSRWVVVNNAGRVLAPGAISQAAVGLPGIVNTRRYLTWVGGADASAFGTAYADFRVRTVEQILPHKPLYAPMPRVLLKQRFLAPSGIESGGRGVPFVEEKFTRFFPRWVFVEQMGNPTLVNRNRTVTTGGYNHEEYGRPTAYLHTRHVQAEGSAFLALGKPRIADSLQKIAATGMLAFRTGTGARVQLYQPDLPFTRELFVASIAPQAAVGRPALRGNALYPLGIASAMAAGRPTVVSMGISPKGIYLAERDKYGRPTLSFDQRVTASGIEAPDNRQRHRVDPHTIWCTGDTPPQASANHDGGGWRAIDDGNIDAFGRPALRMSGPQALQVHNHFAASASGSPRVELRNRIISPVGIRAFRYGWPFIPGTIHCGPVGSSQGAYGRPSVAHYVDPLAARSLAVDGYSAVRWGSARVELQHRQLLASGFNAASVPGPQRVGPPRRLGVQGFAADLYGIQWISLRIRHLQPAGFDAHANGYSIGDFSRRMRVAVVYPAQRVVTVGTDTAGAGLARIENQARVIRPLNCCCGARFGRPLALTG